MLNNKNLKETRALRRSGADTRWRPWQANFLPLASSLLSLLWLVGCAAPADRTKQLLELDLGNREQAIGNLTRDYRTQPEPWVAYSLGVLYGAEGQYQAMNQWFDRCRTLTAEYDEDIIYTRLSRWRDEARAGDQAAARGDWLAAMDYLARALEAAPEKKETRLRHLAARVMALGPGLEEIRALVAAGRPAAVHRWLEQAAAPENAASRLETRVRLTSQLRGAGGPRGDARNADARTADTQTADALATFVASELARMDHDWPEMLQLQEQTAALGAGASEFRKPLAAARRGTGTHLLQQALELFAAEQVPAALAKLDTAAMVEPGRADIVAARRNIRNLERARDARAVNEVLALGDLDTAWLSVWMHRLHHQGRLREAGLVADHLLNHAATLTPRQKNQALRVRVAFSRGEGDLEKAGDALRAMLADGEPQPQVAAVLGDVLLAQSRYEEARHRFEQARDWGDDSVALVLRLAGVAFSQNDFKTMAAWAEVALEEEPDNTEARALLAKARQLGGEVRP